MIKELQKTNRWTFTYMGADIDLTKIQKEFNIPMGNIASYSDNTEGRINSFKENATRTCSYMTDISAGIKCSSSFFEKQDIDKEDKLKE